jgi:DNA-binding NtrC family response regulator
MVVLGSEAPIIHELQQPAPLHHWPQSSSSSSVPRPTAPPLQPAMPPPVAAAAASAPAAVAAAPAGVGIDSVGSVAAPAGASTAGNVSLKDIARSAAREAERELILRMLTRTRWNRKEAAEILGISYKALLYKIKENGLDKAS